METGHKKEFLDMIKRKGERVFDNLSDVVQIRRCRPDGLFLT